LEFRYLAIEGPIGLGKTALAERLGARLDATVVLDETENPFLSDFYGGRAGSAFQAQLFFTLTSSPADGAEAETSSARRPSATTCSTATRSTRS
jgi:deoxyadenosine/deoxycytidine kinase